MKMRWLSLLCAAALLSGCGSSDDSGAARTSTATAAAQTASPTATATVESAELERLPQVPEATGSAPSSASSSHNQFITDVFNDAEALWKREFADAGLTYHPARLTIFPHEVHTACGSHGTDVGPFYCPASSGVYLDTAFFTALSHKVGVRLGDFAQAYVVAHEVGHHVQSLLGVMHQVAAADQADPAGKNARSVRVELQADRSRATSAITRGR